MKKIHMRLSVELEVTDKQFAELVEMSDGCNDIEYRMIPRAVQAMIDAGKYTPCDWDDGGYIPGAWIEWDSDHEEEDE